jgi:uncharacterized membrane protein
VYTHTYSFFAYIFCRYPFDFIIFYIILFIDLMHPFQKRPEVGLLSADSAQAELWKGNSIGVAQELPELLEPETDLYEASQRLKETKQRFWEKRKGGGRGGEKGGKGKGKDGGISDSIY